MKNLGLCTVFMLLNCVTTWSQNTPHAFNYQAVARDATGQAVVAQPIKLKVRFRQGVPTGSIVYEEEHTDTTSLTGFFSLYIGIGTPLVGAYTDVQWGSTLYYMETVLDITGTGNHYTALGVTPIVTIPIAEFAYRADTAEYVVNLPSAIASNAIADGDGDTKIQVEEGTDEDMIRFDIDGSERLVIKSNANGETMLEWPSASNLFIGEQTGQNNTGSSNTFIGLSSGFFNSSGNDNTFLGYSTGYLNATGSNNAFMGYRAGYHNITGFSNTFLGSFAGHNNTTGNVNTFMGYQSGANNTIGEKNTFIGQGAGVSNTVGNSNTFVGVGAGGGNIISNDNTCIGYCAGGAATGFRNVFLGYLAGFNETGNEKLYIEISDSPSPLIYGEFTNDRVVINGNGSHNTSNLTFFVNGSAGGGTVWNNLSDQRLKEDIQTVPNALEKVLRLRGVTYQWKDNREKGSRLGFIAQEVNEVLPEVVDATRAYYTMQYAPLTALLVEAVKMQQSQIEVLKKENQDLKAQLVKTTQLEAKVVALQKQINQLLELLPTSTKQQDSK